VRFGPRTPQSAHLIDLLQAADRREEAMAELKKAVALFAEVGEDGELEPEIWKLSER
jgi:predicted RNase H-like HicB family nuclease